jgi:phage shock protein A
MGMLKRISNIFRSKVNGALDEIENPIELLDQKIRDMEESLNNARIAAADVIGNMHSIEKKMNEKKLEIKDYEEKVKLAVSKGNDELAKKALAKKIDAERELNNLSKTYNETRERADAIKERLRELEDEIEKTRAYRDELVARYQSAKATSKVNEILLDVETKSNKITLDDIERKVSKVEARAEGLSELKHNTLEDEFKELEKIDLDEELKKYKQGV